MRDGIPATLHQRHPNIQRRCLAQARIAIISHAALHYGNDINATRPSDSDNHTWPTSRHRQTSMTSKYLETPITPEGSQIWPDVNSHASRAPLYGACAINDPPHHNDDDASISSLLRVIFEFITHRSSKT